MILLFVGAICLSCGIAMSAFVFEDRTGARVKPPA